MEDARTVYLATPAPEEIADGLASRINATVGTLNEDGSIHLAFVLFLWHEERFWFETSSTTRKVRNIERDPTASIAIDGPGFMVLAEGTGRIVRGEQAATVNGMIRAKYLTPDAAESVGAAWSTVDDVAVEVTPQTWRSWSNAALMELSSRHADGLPRSEWWVRD